MERDSPRVRRKRMLPWPHNRQQQWRPPARQVDQTAGQLHRIRIHRRRWPREYPSYFPHLRPAHSARPSRLGLKNASSGRCRNTKNCTKRPVTSTTGASQPTSPDSATSTPWSRRQQQRYVSGKHAWPRMVNLAVPARTAWRERGRHTTSPTSKTWDLFGSAGSSHVVVGYPPQHVDMLM